VLQTILKPYIVVDGGYFVEVILFHDLARRPPEPTETPGAARGDLDSCWRPPPPSSYQG